MRAVCVLRRRHPRRMMDRRRSLLQNPRRVFAWLRSIANTCRRGPLPAATPALSLPSSLRLSPHGVRRLADDDRRDLSGNVDAIRFGFECITGHGEGARPTAAADVPVFADPAGTLEMIRIAQRQECRVLLIDVDDRVTGETGRRRVAGNRPGRSRPGG